MGLFKRNPISLLLVLFVLVGGLVLLQSLRSKESSPSLSKSQPPKRVAILLSSDVQLSTVEGIKAGLTALGYTEGKDIIFIVRNPKGDRELTKRMAAEIVASNPDLIVPTSTTATKTVREAAKGKDLPIVFVDVGNFKELGITNIKRPGGTMTGVVKENTQASAKRMEILKEVLPKATKFGMFINPTHVSYDELKSIHEETARKLGIKLQMYTITSEGELKKALDKIVKDRPDGFMTVPDAIISSNSELVAQTLRSAKIPTIDTNIEKAGKDGYLLVYGVYRFDVGQQGARLINKVLRGENPGDIPIEFATNPKLEINGMVAKEIGIVIPESVRLRASKIY